MKKATITLSIVLYAIVVPFLEINETHVFNPDWTPHARIHEVWQLITNTSLGLLSLWLVWVKRQTLSAGILSLLIMGGFLLAYFLRGSYGDSMKYLDGTEKTLLGINIGLLGFGTASMLILLAFLIDRSPQSKGN